MSDMRCKICDNLVFHQYALTYKGEIIPWFHCRCGCVFNNHKPDPAIVFNEEYQKKLLEVKGRRERFDYMIRLYAPIIEEKTYKRRMLDVGFGTTDVIDIMTERGWNAEGIDLIKTEGAGLINADFETYDFFGQGHARYDLIWMGDVLQCFKDPIAAIYKAYHLLNPHGLLFINTPNTDLMRTGTYIEWGHWNIDEARQYINEETLRKVLARVDERLSGNMRILFCDPQITCKRFITWNSMHLIVQKEKIEDIVGLEALHKVAEQIGNGNSQDQQ